MTHLLDSSAFFAFFFNEPGGRSIQRLFADNSIVIGLSILTASEFWARLKSQGHESAFDQEWQDHLPLFESVLPVDRTVTEKAVELRRAATARLPTIDSLIAATAAVHGAALVHSDPHFAAIPTDLLRQEVLSGK